LLIKSTLAPSCKNGKIPQRSRILREREREREIPQIIDAPLEPWTQKPQPGNKHNKNNSRPNYRSTTKTEANPLEKS
jgi:hypothetical protein